MRRLPPPGVAAPSPAAVAAEAWLGFSGADGAIAGYRRRGIVGREMRVPFRRGGEARRSKGEAALLWTLLVPRVHVTKSRIVVLAGKPCVSTLKRSKGHRNIVPL